MTKYILIETCMLYHPLKTKKDLTHKLLILIRLSYAIFYFSKKKKIVRAEKNKQKKLNTVTGKVINLSSGLKRSHLQPHRYIQKGLKHKFTVYIKWLYVFWFISGCWDHRIGWERTFQTILWDEVFKIVQQDLCNHQCIRCLFTRMLFVLNII